MQQKVVSITALGQQMERLKTIGMTLLREVTAMAPPCKLAANVRVYVNAVDVMTFRRMLTVGDTVPPTSFLEANERLLLAMDDGAEDLLEEIAEETHGGDPEFCGAAPSILRLSTAVREYCRKAELSRICVVREANVPGGPGRMTLRGLKEEGVETCEILELVKEQLLDQAPRVAAMKADSPEYAKGMEQLWRTLCLGVRSQDVGIVLLEPQLAKLDWGKYADGQPRVINLDKVYTQAVCNWTARYMLKLHDEV